jgi:hypothetical protein
MAAGMSLLALQLAIQLSASINAMLQKRAGASV